MVIMNHKLREVTKRTHNISLDTNSSILSFTFNRLWHMHTLFF